MWHDVTGQNGLPDWWRNALAVEQRSAEIWEYDPLTVPGLLQTKPYASQIIASGMPRSLLDQIDDEVQRRVARLPHLSEHARPPRFKFILGEQALLRPVGDPDVMTEQLDHIMKVVNEHKLMLQVLPWSSTPAWASLPLRINVLDERHSVAYLEHLLGGTTLDNAGTVTSLVSLFGDLASESLPPGASVELIRKVRDQWNG